MFETRVIADKDEIKEKLQKLSKSPITSILAQQMKKPETLMTSPNANGEFSSSKVSERSRRVSCNNHRMSSMSIFPDQEFQDDNDIDFACKNIILTQQKTVFNN